MPRRTVLVVPCFNEAARLPRDAFLRAARDPSGPSFVFVDDGSRDGTGEVLAALRRAAPARIDAASLPKNVGKAEAVRAGMIRAFDEGAEAVGYWDADLATPLEEVPRFAAILKARPDVLAVFGSRVRLLGREVARRPLRHYLGRVFATAASLALELPVYDTQCGAKLFRASPETRALFEEPFLSRWLFDVEILARLVRDRRRRGLSGAPEVYESPLDRWEDVAGSKVKARDFLRAMVEFRRIRARYLAPQAVAAAVPARTERPAPRRSPLEAAGARDGDCDAAAAEGA